VSGSARRGGSLEGNARTVGAGGHAAELRLFVRPDILEPHLDAPDVRHRVAEHVGGRPSGGDRAQSRRHWGHDHGPAAGGNLIRDAARAALERGALAPVDAVLSSTSLGADERRAIRSAVEAAMGTRRGESSPPR
jgi:hypothetical protein